MTTAITQQEELFEKQPVSFVDLLSKDQEGETCITEENLDLLWPRDDSEPIVITGKWLEVPPTCETVALTCEEQHGRQTCLEFLAGGPPPPLTPVPLPSSAPLLIVGIAMFLSVRKLLS